MFISLDDRELAIQIPKDNQGRLPEMIDSVVLLYVLARSPVELQGEAVLAGLEPLLRDSMKRVQKMLAVHGS